MGIDTLNEFLNENLHRNYPIMDGYSARDITDSYNIPTELIADIRLVVPTNTASSGDFFISALVVRRYTIDIEIGYRPAGGAPVPVGWFHNIDAAADSFESYTFVALSDGFGSLAQFSDITGTLVAGIGIPAATLPDSWEFDADSTKLVPTTTEEQLTKFRALVVDDKILTGDIIIEEGDNVTVEVVGNTIKISAKEIEPPDLVINSDEDLLEALIDLFGRPITTINQEPPVNDGNFTLAGADCVQMSTLSNSITVTNPCGKPCCDKETYLDPVYDSVNQLNARHARLDDFLSGVIRNLDTLLSRLKDMENSIGYGGM